MKANEAKLLFAKLHEEKSIVLCSGRLFGLNLELQGKVSKVESDQIQITAIDEQAGVVLSLAADGLVFDYRQARHYPSLARGLPEDARDTMAIVIGFPNRGDIGFDERVIVAEVFPIK
jgi:hypothetical protein